MGKRGVLKISLKLLSSNNGTCLEFVIVEPLSRLRANQRRLKLSFDLVSLIYKLLSGIW